MMIEHYERALGIRKSVGRFVQRAKEIVSAIVVRVKDMVSAIFADGGTAVEAQDAVDTLLGSLPETIATTEVHTEVEQAIADVFEEQGVELVEWVTEPGACPVCADNEEQGPIKRGTAFASGGTAPPAHPRCKCNLVPSAIEEQA